MGASAKMDVDISGFKKGMQDAQTILKGLNAELKSSEAEFKATGNAEKLMTDKTQTLTSKLNIQKSIVEKTQAALKQMTDAGVDPADKAYQQLYAQLMNAQAGMYETQAALNSLGTSAQQAATGADQLTKSVNSIGKKISLQQVIGGIDKITSGLEKATQKAFQLGEAIWSQVLSSASWADDTATMSMILGMDVEDYQKYKKVFDTIGEITVQEWVKVKQKVEKAMVNPSNDQSSILSMLGISTQQWSTVAGQSGSSLVTRPWEDIFWEAGQKLREKVAEGLMSQEEADVYAQALFGKSAATLNPLLNMGREAFEKALKEQNVNTEEEVNNLAALNDQLIKLQGDFDTLQAKLLSGLAPALEGAAKSIDGLLGRILEYLDSEDGQKALDDMAKAVEGLFTDISQIDPEKVVEGFTSVFNTIVGGLQWLVENKDGVITALEAIVTGWGVLKLTGGALQIANMISGLTGLGGGAAEATAAGEAAGTAFGSGFGAAVMKAVPWLAGALVLTKNAYTPQGNDDLYNKNGELTQWGEEVGAAELEPEEKALIVAQTKAIEDRNRAQAQIRAEAMHGNVGDFLITALGGAWLLPLMESARTRNGGGGSEFGYSDPKMHEAAHVLVEPEAVENSAKELEEQIGVVTLPARVVLNSLVYAAPSGVDKEMGYANGIDFVPDTRLAWLHRGERVVPAREIQSRSYNSNLYVESMYMNNGTDAAGLAAAMAAAQRRTMSGYGS